MASPAPAIADDPFDPSRLFFSSSSDAGDLKGVAFPLPSAFSPGLDFGDDLDLDLDLDFSVDDFFVASDPPDPPSDPVSGDGSGVSSLSPHDSGPSSPISGHSASNLPERCGSGCDVVVEDGRGLKVEEDGEDKRGEWSLKRKSGEEGEREDEGLLDCDFGGNPRSGKYRRSDEGTATSSCVFSAGNDFSAGNEEDDKRKARLIRNRESAQLSRQRKKQYVEELEEKVNAMHSTINDLNSRISFIMAENVNLRQQLGGGGAAAAGVYPQPGAIAHMPVPWIPGYALRPPGSQMAYVPIPRLKPQQQPASAPKVKKSEKNAEKRTKKVAGVSILGFMLIMLLCGVLVPGVNFRFGETTKSISFASSGNFGRSNGRVLSVDGRSYGANNSGEAGLCSGKVGFGQSDTNMVSEKGCQNGKLGYVKPNGSRSWPRHGSEAYVPVGNSSETLPALLYVPRNGKRVKINGNLIIHSVLAGEKALAQEKAKQSSGKEAQETGLALTNNLVPLLAAASAGREVDRQPAPDKYVKKGAVDAPLQQWFREGMAGPILSSGMCTEVFQFESSPSSDHSSGIIRAASVLNTTASVNATENISPTSDHPMKLNNRRMKHAEPIPLNGTALNSTSQFQNKSESSHFNEKKPVSSMVVSVLADPREAGDGDGEGRVSPNSISRIFVVVLMDSVKYVTYSCVLPFKTSAPHLVN